MRSGSQDYYKILGVKEDASQESIQKSYRKLARKYHPDVSDKSGSEEKFKELCEAYDVLKDPKKRKQYDRFGPAFENMNTGGAHHKHTAAGQGGFGVNMGFGDMDDIFSSVFGRSGASFHNNFTRQRESRRARDYETDINITLDEAFFGVKKRFSLGESVVGGAVSSGGGKSISVKIPKGVTEGSKIKLSAQKLGLSGYRNIYLRVRILPHPIFKLDGSDILVDVFTTPWELALGAQINVPTLERPLRMTIAPGTQPDQKLRVQGKGFPDKKTGGYGNLIVQVKVAIPKKLSPLEKQLFEELSQCSQFNPRKQRY